MQVCFLRPIRILIPLLAAVALQPVRADALSGADRPELQAVGRIESGVSKSTWQTAPEIP